MRAATWMGAGLFLASLLYFAWFYLIWLGQPAAVATERIPAAVSINVALFTTFALHHSLFARAGAKALLRRLGPPALERVLYVWVASLLLIAVCALWQPLPGVAWQAAGAGRWVLHAVQAAGIALTLKSASRIDIWELAGVGPAEPTPPPRPGQAGVPPSPALSAPLESDGPYRWVRHPIYLGWVLVVFGAPTMTSGRLLFAGVSTLYLVLAIPLEERGLQSQFGQAYKDYQRKVRWRLVPGVW